MSLNSFLLAAFISISIELYIQKIKYILDTDLDKNENVEIYFVEEVYDTMGQLIRTVDLIPNGSKVRVRNENKSQYLDALATHRLSNNVKDEIDSFLKGLNLIIPDNLLSIFDENELEVLVLFSVYIYKNIIYISSILSLLSTVVYFFIKTVYSCYFAALENIQLQILKHIISLMDRIKSSVEY